MPLIYATRLRVEHEAYAAALARFPRLVERGDSLELKVVDGAVALFRVDGRERLRRACFDALIESPSLAITVGRSSALRCSLPDACLAAEREFLGRKAVGRIALTRLFEALADAIALNLLNPFVEAIFLTAQRLFAGSPLFDDLVHSLQSGAGFSYLQFFQTRLDALAAAAANGAITDDDYIQFCWEVGFLAGAGSERTDYDSPCCTARLMGDPIFRPGYLAWPKQPRATCLDVGDPGPAERLLKSENLLERTVGLLSVLRLHEDVRHYWQCRSCRLFRVLATSHGEYDHHRPFQEYVRA